MNLSGPDWIFRANERENSMTLNYWKCKGGRSKRRTVRAIALLSFTVGSLITARLAHIEHVRADSNRVFELRVYHTLPGKVPALEPQFRDITSKLLAKHDLKACTLRGLVGGVRASITSICLFSYAHCGLQLLVV
jgi:hypothetical protein